jgi:hypothetical protein
MTLETSEHPAVIAWRGATGIALPATRIDTLQGETFRSVWRLFGCGPQGESIIAKRCRIEEARRERDIYQRIIPKLPVFPVRCHGYLDDDHDVRLAWVFLEDIAGDLPHSVDDAQHRQWLGHWLAVLHTSGSTLDPQDHALLRDRGTTHFRQYLDYCLENTEGFHSNPALSIDDHRILDELLFQARQVDDCWMPLEAFCKAMPAGIVHGDFKPEHVYWHVVEGRPILRMIDWNEAGWGPPALDLAKFLGYRVAPDAQAYVESARQFWPRMSLEDLYRLGAVGELFRAIASVRWAIASLEYGKIERATTTLRVYRDWMAQIIAAAPWSDAPDLLEARRIERALCG